MKKTEKIKNGMYVTHRSAGKVVEQIKHIIAELGPECKIEVVESPRIRDLEVLLSEARDLLIKVSDNYPICTNVPEPILYKLLDQISSALGVRKVIYD